MIADRGPRDEPDRRTPQRGGRRPAMAAMRGADVIAEYLISEKVPYVFGLCGHGIVGLMDALGSRADRIKMVGGHHEQVAGYMADASYRIPPPLGGAPLREAPLPGSAPRDAPARAAAGVQDRHDGPAWARQCRRPARRLRRGNHRPAARARPMVARDRPSLRPVARDRAPAIRPARGGRAARD